MTLSQLVKNSTVHFERLLSEIWKCFTKITRNFALGDGTFLQYPELSLLNEILQQSLSITYAHTYAHAHKC